MMVEVYVMIGDNIREFRLKYGYDQSELAEKLHISNKTVSSWELGRSEPRMGMIEDMCKIFHCTKSELIDGATNNDFMVYSINKADSPHLANIDSVSRLTNYAHLFASLSDSNKEIIIQTMKAMGAAEEKKPTDSLKGYFNRFRGMSNEDREKR
jgi:transcriptional regulator with XRE-family HTH domain